MDARPSRNEKAEIMLYEALGLFVARESNRTSLITVTGVRLERAGTVAVVYVSVIPDHGAKGAVDFLSRRTEEARAFIKKRVRISKLPQVRFVHDDSARTREILENLGTTTDSDSDVSAR
jgi:ribosome-binding factor A